MLENLYQQVNEHILLVAPPLRGPYFERDMGLTWENCRPGSLQLGRQKVFDSSKLYEIFLEKKCFLIYYANLQRLIYAPNSLKLKTE